MTKIKIRTKIIKKKYEQIIRLCSLITNLVNFIEIDSLSEENLLK